MDVIPVLQKSFSYLSTTFAASSRSPSKLHVWASFQIWIIKGVAKMHVYGQEWVANARASRAQI